MAPEYGELEVANDYLDDPEKLNAVLERQGYLFFRAVLDAGEVGAVREDFAAELRRQGFAAPGLRSRFGPARIWRSWTTTGCTCSTTTPSS